MAPSLRSDLLLPISIVILAGGRGRRMGVDKASVQLAGETLLNRAVRRMSHLSHDIIVVSRPDQCPTVAGARLAHDLAPYGGVLAGIAAGVEAADHDWVFVMAVDMPFVDVELVRRQFSLRHGYDAIVPRLEVGVEPLHALYSKVCLAALREVLKEGSRRVISFYSSVRVRYLDCDPLAWPQALRRSFYNINTDADLLLAEKWLRETTVSDGRAHG